MRKLKNLPANLDDLGALKSLLPKDWPQGGTGDSEGGPGKYKRPIQTRETIRAKLMAQIVENVDSKCWEWTGNLDSRGYGRCHILSYTFKAHRVSWLLFRGDIVDGLNVCHSCDNPKCVNPEHLWLGTNEQNRLDSKLKGRTARMRGEKSGMAKLTEAQVIEIRSRWNLGEKVHSIVKDYPVSVRGLRHIVYKTRWSWIE